jgi:RND family efflux transporter MFP subunit
MSEPSEKRPDITSLRIDREKIRPRKRPIWLIIIIALFAVVGIFIFIRSPNFIPFLAPKVSTARSVVLTPTQASTVLTSSGYVVARRKAEISPKSVGRIAWINLEEGQKVKKGELVARLENQELKAKRAEVVSRLENAKREEARQEKLYKRGIATEQARDNSKTQVKVLRAQLSNIDELIRNTNIYSPIDGVVTVKKAFLGETVTPQGFGGAGSAGATFAVIVDLDSLEVETDINEQNLGKLNQGMPAEIILDAFPDHPYKARLRQIVPTADRQKGTFEVKVEFVGKDEKVMPEMSCRVNFLNRKMLENGFSRRRIVVPLSALVEYNGEKGVFIVEGNRVKFRGVTTGFMNGSQVEIEDGLQGGEQLVVEAATLNLQDGERIRLNEE